MIWGKSESFMIMNFYGKLWMSYAPGNEILCIKLACLDQLFRRDFVVQLHRYGSDEFSFSLLQLNFSLLILTLYKFLCYVRLKPWNAILT